MKRLFVEFFCLLVTFFKVKKVGSNPTFYCFWTKKVASYEKNCKWKTSCKIKYVSKNFVNLSKYPPHPAFNFEVMKWCWTNKRIINKLFCETANIQLRKFKFKGLKLVWYHSSNLISFICSKFCEALLWPNIITVLSNAPKQQFEYWDF